MNEDASLTRLEPHWGRHSALNTSLKALFQNTVTVWGPGQGVKTTAWWFCGGWGRGGTQVNTIQRTGWGAFSLSLQFSNGSSKNHWFSIRPTCPGCKDKSDDFHTPYMFELSLKAFHILLSLSFTWVHWRKRLQLCRSGMLTGEKVRCRNNWLNKLNAHLKWLMPSAF